MKLPIFLKFAQTWTVTLPFDIVHGNKPTKIALCGPGLRTL